jgi:3-ketosteroid 9alpha-monooxygenase subunit A
MLYGGWYLIAFERDLTAAVTPIRIGPKRLMCVRGAEGIKVYDAVCPHRGSNLAMGGRLDGSAIICPFHGHRVSLGANGANGFCVAERTSFIIDGLVFTMLGDFDDGELPRFLHELGKNHRVFPGFEKIFRVAPEMVIENVFDASHFVPVHSVMEVEASKPSLEKSVLTVHTKLRVGPSAWQGAADDGTFIEVPLCGRAFSPSVTVTEIAVGGGDHPHYVIAGATPQGDGNSVLRFSIALPRGDDGSEPSADLAKMLLEYEGMGVEQDRSMWENLDPSAPQRYTGQDTGVLVYHDFCARFALDETG